MFKQIVMTLAISSLSLGAQAETWQETVKQSIDATTVAEIPLLPNGATSLSDLTPDSAFGTAGMQAFWPDGSAGMSQIEYAVRTFPHTVCTTGTPIICSHGGYYVVANLSRLELYETVG
jgi:hypothetical protein